jgi:hypothetical protein
MYATKADWKCQRPAFDLAFHGVRVLSRVSFVLVVFLAWGMNEADQAARAVGMLSFRVEASWNLGSHACMQPEAEELRPEPEPEKPPCPRQIKQERQSQ